MADKVYILKDTDYDVMASVHAADGGQPALVTVMAPDRDAFITMRADDFTRLAASVAQALG